MAPKLDTNLQRPAILRQANLKCRNKESLEVCGNSICFCELQRVMLSEVLALKKSQARPVHRHILCLAHKPDIILDWQRQQSLKANTICKLFCLLQGFSEPLGAIIAVVAVKPFNSSRKVNPMRKEAFAKSVADACFKSVFRVLSLPKRSERHCHLRVLTTHRKLCAHFYDNIVFRESSALVGIF